jgi:hypothetical protein
MHHSIATASVLAKHRAMNVRSFRCGAIHLELCRGSCCTTARSTAKPCEGGHAGNQSDDRPAPNGRGPSRALRGAFLV